MNNESLPLVSVIMPVYNAGRFLVPAIESILNQTYKKYELILVDDGSVDGSDVILDRYQRLYPDKITYLKTPQKTNAAGNGATNYGMQFAKGEFIARMDADDISLPKRIEKQVDYMISHPGTIIVGSQAIIIDKYGKKTGVKSMPTTNGAIYRQFSQYHPFIHPSVMIRRSLLPLPNRIYSMRWDVNDDYYTFFSLLRYGYVANLPEALIKYRIHGNNLSLEHPKQKFMNSVKIRLEAVKKLGYAMSPLGFLIIGVQVLFVSLIPEKLVVPIYMTVRGIQSPVNIFSSITSWIKKQMSKIPINSHALRTRSTGFRYTK